MPKDKKAINEYSDEKPSLRLEPEKRMCPIFDSVSIAKLPIFTPPLESIKHPAFQLTLSPTSMRCP